MRLIDADELVERTEILYQRTASGKIIPWTAVRVCVINNAPTIDAVPVVHARWVHEQRYGDSGGWVWRCTACRHEAISPIISALQYCHHCGAKMDEKEDGE